MARAEYLPLSVIRSVRTAVDDKLDALRADSHFLPHLRSYSEGRGLDPERRLDMRKAEDCGATVGVLPYGDKYTFSVDLGDCKESVLGVIGCCFSEKHAGACCPDGDKTTDAGDIREHFQ
jgi:hypothetical protein